MSKETVSVSYEDIWTPTFALAQCEDDPCVIRADEDSDIHVLSTGEVQLSMLRLLSSFCQLDLRKFPFDSQTCLLSFWLMRFTSQQVNILMLSRSAEFFDFFSDEWQLSSVADFSKNFTAKIYERNEDYSWNRDRLVDTKSAVYVGFVVQIGFTRYYSFYIYNLIIPVFINSFLGILSCSEELR